MCPFVDLIISAHVDPSVCGLWCRSATTRLLGLWVRIPPAEWIFVSCKVVRCLCDGRVPCPGEGGSYRMCVRACVIKCNNNPYTYEEQKKPE